LVRPDGIADYGSTVDATLWLKSFITCLGCKELDICRELVAELEIDITVCIIMLVYSVDYAITIYKAR
jgi:hypothetical protein